MSMRIYFKLSAFDHPLDGIEHYDRYLLSHPDGDPYLTLRSGTLPETTELPPGVKQEDVDKVTYQTNFFGGGSSTSREAGEYRFRSAIAFVERDIECNHSLRLEAKNLKDAVILYSDIRAGNIPPKVSYEKGQVPSPARHVRQLWGEFWGILYRGFYQKLSFLK